MMDETWTYTPEDYDRAERILDKIFAISQNTGKAQRGSVTLAEAFYRVRCEERLRAVKFVEDEYGGNVRATMVRAAISSFEPPTRPPMSLKAARQQIAAMLSQKVGLSSEEREALGTLVRDMDEKLVEAALGGAKTFEDSIALALMRHRMSDTEGDLDMTSVNELDRLLAREMIGLKEGR